jgi:hypothetical protein
MNRNVSILFALALTVTTGQKPSLEPLKPIGVSWNLDQWAWMSFVAFNDKGNEVASDGATSPTDVSGELSFWSFPEGRFIQKLPVRPTAISEDFKYYASQHSVGDLVTGKTLLTLGEDTFATFSFSRDSHYIAQSLWEKAERSENPRAGTSDAQAGK